MNILRLGSGKIVHSSRAHKVQSWIIWPHQATDQVHKGHEQVGRNGQPESSVAESLKLVPSGIVQGTDGVKRLSQSNYDLESVIVAAQFLSRGIRHWF